ncbi:trypsin-like peptidase domain-containing protein [Salipaludibacillus agaradhaerens]|uniref:Trypsin-like peptidase domain-containing protein n=1 Tax=Salipaludibacillus agaradhaerens TaxID=76935 RepID=A0A9Q4G0T6_SALAG|nr:trypsin-like peptidase domain-containing protein [Salipaludibacillus agaradhaerens]MCR6098851.1 trypsin-like peptidase domain-containing protein [Salipaludibacillus agaradhaerens]MCR6112651.1 trypsin-like peptidase domain-containing protein [Bacillus sp. A301a_S52]MCR6115858.1 trypsin-like peptidase domain-containing protein [Salipaludibacillus agaradhaerens]
MGYYDDHTSQPDDQKPTQKGKKRSGLYGFVGAVLGALIVVFSIPVLANNGVLPYEVTPKNVSSTDNDEAVSSGVDMEAVETLSLETTSEVIEAVDRVSDAVVGVVNMQQSSGLFDAEDSESEGTGSGVIYKVEGDYAFIVTNQHVINGASQGSSDIDVTLGDGSRVPAELVGEDLLTDLAVLTIDSEGIETVAEFGDSESLQSGEPAIAIGNPLTFEGTVTLGIISAVERSLPVDLTGNGQPDWNSEVLQTDAAINPGNSGGALLNIQGDVIGINSMKIAQSAVEGIGFAIPTAVAMPVIEDLEQYGEVQRPQMGIALRSLQEIPSFHWQDTLGLPEEVKGGVYVEAVEADTPAAEAGLEEGDVITALDDTDITDSHDLRSFLYKDVNIGDTITVTFYRDGEEQTVELTLDKQVF